MAILLGGITVDSPLSAEALAFQLAEDVKIFIEVLEYSVGPARLSILFNFGERAARKFCSHIHSFPIKDRKRALNTMLGYLEAAGWFDQVENSIEGEKIEINIAGCFELQLGLKRCDFLRGFLNGSLQELYDRNYFGIERCKDGGRVQFSFEHSTF